ncbi:MAG: sigma 54-interacting transcriptional regulator [Gemmataceae bacterium]
MSPENGAYLVVRRDDGYGEAHPLISGQRYTLGRAPTNRIVLADEMCSREHAEVYQADQQWFVRDLNSLNGTRVNGKPLERHEWQLTPTDEVHLGKTTLVYVEDMNQLKPLSASQPVAIKKRLGETQYLNKSHKQPSLGSTIVQDRNRLTRDLAQLYQLALEMASAATFEELVHLALDGLLEALPADVGAILSVKEGRNLSLIAHRHREAKAETYHKVSRFVSNEVLSTREAILAEDVAHDRHLSDRDSIADLGATSLICAPVLGGDKVTALIHLYCTTPLRALDAEDLEFTVAVAKQMSLVTQQLERQVSLSRENQSLRAQLRVESELVGDHPAIQEVISQVARVAGTQATVLIRGESGVGKELVARAIHYSSPRKDGPFICLNCAALSETLLESELFGHEKGAFTGATEKLIGKFESADHGTIFLDEIGEMSVGTQAKLLRVLEGHPFERVGGNTPIRVDVRVVAATNQPLEKALQAGAFRRDLFFRLQVVEIRVPPLRERPSDIALLAEHFLKRFVRETGRKIRSFTPAALMKMRDYHWPGNVRELRNVVERAVALSTSPTIDANDIWLSSLDLDGVATVPSLSPAPAYEPLSIEEIEKRHILRTLEHTAWNKSQAAAILRIERSTLDRKIKAYELRKEE